MQRQQPSFVGIDVGTNSVKCIIGVDQIDTEYVQIIGLGVAPNTGMRRGSVVNVEETIEAVNQAISEAERTSGYSIDRATVSVNGTHIKSKHSKGVIAVSGGDREIDVDDVARVDEAATVVQIPPNREILHVIPRTYRLDGQQGIKDPVGMKGVRLEVEALLLTGSTPAVKNLHQVLYQSRININDQYVGGLAASHSVVKREQREAGVAMIDIGHSTTTVAVHEEDELLYLTVLPIGSSHITHDLAIGLQTDLKTAEKVKLLHAESSANKTAKTINVQNERKETFSAEQKFINEITMARTEEIFELVNQSLDTIERQAKLPGGAVICGGGAKLTNIVETARRTLSLPVEIGKPSGFTGVTDNVEEPDIATVAGLMMLDRLGSTQPRSNFRPSLKKTEGILRTIFERLKP